MDLDITDPKTFTILMGLAWVIGVIYFSYLKYQFIKHGIKTTGKVIDTYFPKSHEHLSFTIKIEFITSSGHKMAFSQQPLKMNDFVVGDQVEIIHDKAYPQYALINKPLFLWRWEFLFFIGGICILLIGIS